MHICVDAHLCRRTHVCTRTHMYTRPLLYTPGKERLDEQCTSLSTALLYVRAYAQGAHDGTEEHISVRTHAPNRQRKEVQAAAFLVQFKG